MPDPTPVTWPWTGREPELAAIAAARADPGCPGVVVEAPAGAGKSRLGREACAAAERGGALVAWVQATTSAAAIPLGAFAGLLPEDVRTDDTLELLRRCVDRLRERAGARPVLVAVDDAQLLDPVSAALVLHLTTAEAAFVLATVRSGEPCPDAIVSLWKDAGAQRLELGPLAEPAVDALVEAALDGPVEQRVLRWLEQSSRGNPLYVRELVLGALADGALAPEQGLWRMRDWPPPVGGSLAALVARRMAGLGADARAPLELLALGEPLAVDALAALTSEAAVEAAEAAGMAVAATARPGPDVRLAHPLYGDVIRAELPVLRARALRRRLAAAALEGGPPGPEEALRVARWLLDAGEPIPAALAVEAAEAALGAGDPDLGAELAQRAGETVPARMLLARAHAARRRFETAEAILAELEGAFTTQDTAVAYLRLRAETVLYWGLGRLDAAQELGERAQAWWPDAEWDRRLAPVRLMLEGMRHGFAGATGRSAELLADPGLPPAVRRQVEPLHAIALWFTGRAKESWAFARTIKPPVPLRDESATLALRAWTILGLESGEDWDELAAGSEDVVRAGIRANDLQAAGIGATAIAALQLARGRYADMARWGAEAELHLERTDAQGMLVTVRALQVGRAQGAGDPDGAAAALARMHGALGGEVPRAIQVPYVARAEAWAALSRGDPAEAQRGLLAAADAHEVPSFAAQLAYEALRAGAPAGPLAAAQAERATRSDARLVAAYAAHTVALAERDGPGLVTAAEALAAIGALRYGMEAAAHAAAAFLDAGREDSARRAAALAGELHVPGQGASPPDLGGLGGGGAGLTAREAQLAELAAAGLSNAEIADRLVLSVRTVESHLYHAMQKLGVSDRRELRPPPAAR